MRTLALMEQGLRLSVDGDLLSVERERAVIQQVRSAELDQVLVFGNVALTPAAIALLLRRGIDTVLLSANGRFRGRLVGHASKNIELRVMQYERLRDPAVALSLARAIVAGKVANQRQILLRAQREHAREDLAAVIARLRHLIEQAQGAEQLEELRGLEGGAAALYFSALGSCIRNPEFSFKTRSRRPPRDPANAVLSFGYTLLGLVMESIVLRVGLEPMLGAFHAPEYGRMSLVLDLIEEFRPIVVDSLMLRMVNRRELTPEDFEAAPRQDEDDALCAGDREEASPAQPAGIWLNDSGRKVLFRAWGRRLREVMLYPPQCRRLTLEEIMEQQVYAFARLVRGEETEYRAFAVR